MLPVTHWILREVEAQALQRVSESAVCAGETELVRRLLAQRGVGTEEQMQQFLNPELKTLSDRKSVV